jgi:hypothetical protein
MNATIVKVTVDTPCTMTVSSVTEAQGQYGPQIRFEGQDGNGTVTVFEKLERVDEQLRRAGMDRASVIGRTITLYKENATANGKTFPALRISVADGGTAAPRVAAPAPAPAAVVPANGDRLAASFSLYDRCFTHAHSVATRQGITDAQAIASMAATIFIQASR